MERGSVDMLKNILDQLNQIHPVTSLYENNENLYVEFSDYIPTESETLLINNILSSWPLVKAKSNKIVLLDNNWREIVKTGWQSPNGYNLGIDVSDVALLNGAFTLAKEASNIGINDPATIVDINGQSHSMSLQDLTLLMLQYGQARSLLSNTYATIKQSINSASSLEELESIDINI